jgi:hypothetical protein
MASGRTTASRSRTDRAALKRSEWLVRAALVFCALYALVAFQDRHTERFPFFSWTLFSDVPDPKSTDYSVRLLERDGTVLTPPLYYADAKLVDQGQLVQANRQMKGLGRAIEREGADSPGSVYRAAVFEDQFLGKYQSGRFEVVKRTFDIRDRFDCHCFSNEEVLGEFTFG